MVGRPARRPDRTTAVNSGRRRRRACAGNTSGGELLATLAPATGEDRPARAGAHPQPEAVGLGPTAVVRLERALAHEVLPLHDIDGAHPPVDGRARGAGRGEPRPAPRKLVTADRHTPGAPRARTARRRDRPQTPTSITEEARPPETGRIPTAHGPPRRRPARAAARRADGPATRPPGPGIVAGLWMRLLASPSLRVGRQGHDAWADPVGHPTAELPVLPPERPLTCTDAVGAARHGARQILAGRAHPVDSDVEPVRARIHSG